MNTTQEINTTKLNLDLSIHRRNYEYNLYSGSICFGVLFMNGFVWNAYESYAILNCHELYICNHINDIGMLAPFHIPISDGSLNCPYAYKSGHNSDSRIDHHRNLLLFVDVSVVVAYQLDSIEPYSTLDSMNKIYCSVEKYL